MVVNAIEGVIENGKIRLDENVTLPERARVLVIVSPQAVVNIYSPRLANPEQAKDLRKQVIEVVDNGKV
jgi:hypothetical protein